MSRSVISECLSSIHINPTYETCTLIKLTLINIIYIYIWSHICTHGLQRYCWGIAYHYPSLEGSILATSPYQTHNPSANTMPTCLAASSTCCSRNPNCYSTAKLKSLLKLFCGFRNPLKHLWDCLCTLWTNLNVSESYLHIKSHIWWYHTCSTFMSIFLLCYVWYSIAWAPLHPPTWYPPPTCGGSSCSTN